MKVRFLLGAAMLPLAMGSTPAFAEEAPAAAADQNAATIVVTGQRRLSRDPADAKRLSIATVDSVGSLEIQQLTDRTVADALIRLPGIALQRAFQGSKAWYVSIRGLNGNYNSVDLDGGMFIDSTRNDRQNYLDTVPAAAINELVVTKTVTPDMDANSIGGHISILTLRSFDLNGQPLYKADGSLEFFGQNGALRLNGPGVNGNVVVKQTFGENGDFGFVLAASGHNTRSSELFNNAGGYTRVNGVGIPSGLIQQGNFDHHDSGYSLLGKIEARSADRLYAFLAVNHFKGDISQINSRGGTAIVTANVSGATEAGGTFVSGTAQANSRRYDINRRVTTVTGGVELKLTDVSKLSATLSYGRSNHDETVWNGAFFSYTGLSGSYAQTPNAVQLTINPNAGLGIASNWRINPANASGITRLPMTDNVYTGRLDYNHNNFDHSRGFGFSAGVSARRLDRNFVQFAQNYTLPTGTVYSLQDVLANSRAPSIIDGVRPVFVDFDRFWGNLAQNGILRTVQSPSSSFRLIEDALAGYGALYFTTEKLRVLAGARYERTYVDNTSATILANGTATPYAFKRQYGNFLPNVQANYALTDALKLRAAYTRTFARPIFSTFSPGLTLNNFSGTIPFTRATNPNLRARLSENLDASIEWYGQSGNLSVGIFHKNIANEVYFRTTSITDTAGTVVSIVLSPENAGSSKLTGLEISGEWHGFERIAQALDGFSIRGNLTILDGRLTAIDSANATRTINALTEQPRYLANLILAYDKGPLAGSLAWSRRGETFGGSIGARAELDSWIRPFSTLDAKLAIRPLKHFEFYVEATNLTKSWWRETTGANRDQLLTAIQPGRSFTVGVKAQF
jgi:iron complex outermembrane recepter protein